MAAHVAQAQSTAPSREVLAELAPKGKVRAAINFGNPVLAQGGPAAPAGVSVDLARALAERVGLPLEIVPYTAAGRVFETAGSDAWDIAFIAIEPVRAEVVEFTAPYVLIEGTYMVRTASPARTVADLDRSGTNILVGRNSAYDLYLTRTLKAATLVRLATSDEAIRTFADSSYEAVAGVRQPLAAYAKTDPRVRVLPDKFQEIRQAMGTPKGRQQAVAYVQAFLEEMKANGFVRAALDRSGQADTPVAPAATRRP